MLSDSLNIAEEYPLFIIFSSNVELVSRLNVGHLICKATASRLLNDKKKKHELIFFPAYIFLNQF